ncbi:MAG: MoxR family ATPase [Planctomycetes bacterium]|jgi:MoxR-like ATPase|nr:MoxR family ATPase [Planctomycetota bacterium]MCL4730233.1 MoxR family ATPase [Planctomycetota bacterium]
MPAALAAKLATQLSRALIGKPEVVRLLLTGLFARGHVLIEDMPGLGKTTLARALARAVNCDFKRVQFTPDLLPTDIIGTSVYRQQDGTFEWRPGPIFTNILLADEINRATPRTQSALLEAMGELQITAEGTTHRLSRPFFVVATQNPIEHAGTYPLPESQLDRFMLKFEVGYPGAEDEKKILFEHAAADTLQDIEQVLTREDVLVVQEAVKKVRVEPAIADYILEIVAETRNHPKLVSGVSPRGSVALLRAAQAHALIEGRDYVVPDDIKALAVPALAHRVIERASFDRRGGKSGQEIIRKILGKVAVNT